MQLQRLFGPLQSDPRIICRFLRSAERMKDLLKQKWRGIVAGLNLRRTQVVHSGALKVASGDAKMGIIIVCLMAIRIDSERLLEGRCRFDATVSDHQGYRAGSMNLCQIAVDRQSPIG